MWVQIDLECMLCGHFLCSNILINFFFISGKRESVGACETNHANTARSKGQRAVRANANRRRASQSVESQEDKLRLHWHLSKCSTQSRDQNESYSFSSFQLSIQQKNFFSYLNRKEWLWWESRTASWELRRTTRESAWFRRIFPVKELH